MTSPAWMRQGGWSLPATIRAMAFCLLASLATAPTAVYAQAPIVATFANAFYDSESNFYGWLSHIDGRQVGDLQPYTALGGTKYYFPGNGATLFSGQLGGTNDGFGMLNVGVQRRVWLGDSILGAGLWYDINESRLGNVYQQGALSLELFIDNNWTIRGNGFLPVGTRTRNILDVASFSNIAFQGNNLIADRFVQRLDETAMKGLDIEIARSLGDWSGEAFVGYYNFQGRVGGQTNGIKGGVRGYVTPRLAANVTVSNDPLFGTNVFGGFTWFLGGPGGNAPATIEDKLTIPVVRNSQVAVHEVQSSTNNLVILTDQGNPITIAHVQGGAAGANDGTFENPFNTNALPGTQPTDIVYVHADGTYTNGYTLAANQRLLGEGGGNTHLVNTDQLGAIVLPPGIGGVNVPIVLGQVQVANGSEVSNLSLQPTTIGILANGITGNVNVNRTQIAGGTTGIEIFGGSGTIAFSDVSITDPTSAAIRVDGGSATATFDAASVVSQSAGGSAILVENGHGGQLAFDGLVQADSGNGLQFDNADGTYAFNGPVTLNGGDAGIDILGNSDGTFTFGSNTSIQNPTGTAFNVVGDTLNNPSITYSGTIMNNAGQVIAIQDTAAGPNAITFNSGAADAIQDTGGGILLNNNNQNVNILADTELSGLSGIDILGGSGTYTFMDTDLTDISLAPSFSMVGSTASIEFQSDSSITINPGNFNSAVSVIMHPGGTLNFDGSITTMDGNGLQFIDADGTYNFNGPINLLAGDAGIDIIADSNGTFTFNNPTIHNDAFGTGVVVMGGMAQTTFNGLDIMTNFSSGMMLMDAGLTTVNGVANIDATFGPALDIWNTQIDMTFNNIVSTDSFTEGINLDMIHAGSTLAINGITDINNSLLSGIDIDSSQGTFTFANIDIDDTLFGDGIRLNNNTTTAININSGQIDGITFGDGIHSTNTSGLTVQSTQIGGSGAIGDDGIEIVNDDATSRSVVLRNNSIGQGVATGNRGIFINSSGTGTLTATLNSNAITASNQAILTNDGGSPGSLVLNLTGNSTLTTNNPGTFTMELAGSGLHSTIVQSWSGAYEIIGQGVGTGGGILFNRVTFDASGTALAGTQVDYGGTLQIGQGAAAAQRVQGDGLSLLAPTGDLRIGTLNIFNNAGTGLEVDTKSPPGPTTFNLATSSGTINTTGGSALFLDPLTGDMMLDNVTSLGSSLGLGGTDAGASGNGAGVFIDELHGNGLGGNALTITMLDIDNPATEGLMIGNSSGNFTIHGGDISGAGGTAFMIDMNAPNVNYGGTIYNTSGLAVAATNRTGGDVDFWGRVTDDGGAGMLISGNSGGTVEFHVR